MDLLVNIDVDRLDKAIDFYCRAFNLRVGRRFQDSGVELLGASSPLYLLVKPAGSRASTRAAQQRDYQRHWTPVHLDFAVDDLPAAVQQAHAAGAQIEDDIQRFNWGIIAHLADPFGNGFCLLQFLGGGYDEIAD